MCDADVLHVLKNNEQAKGLSLPVEFWRLLPEKLSASKAILLQTAQQRNQKVSDVLLFIYETEQGKVVVKMDYEVAIKDQLTGKKQKAKLNLVRTVSIVDDFTQLGVFKTLWGKLQ